MTNIKDIRDTFTEIVSENQQIINKLDAEEHETLMAKAKADAEYLEQISAAVATFLLPFDHAAVKALSALHGNADLGADYNRAISETRNAEFRMSHLTATHGDERQVASLYTGMDKAVREYKGHQQLLASKAEVLDASLEAIDAFNAKAPEGKPLIGAGTLGQFENRGFWAWLTDGHYREGRAIVKGFAESRQDISGMIAQREQLREDLPYAGLEVTNAEAERKRLDAVLADMRGTRNKIRSDGEIQSDIASRMVEMFKDDVFFNKAVKAMPERFPAIVVEKRAKAAGLGKVADALHLRSDVLRKATGSLDKQLPKLNKAVRNGRGSRSVSGVDLPKIRGAFQSQRNAACYSMREMGKARRSISNFNTPNSAPHAVQVSSAASDPTDFYMNMMIYDMVFDHGHHHHHEAADPFAVNAVFGIPETMAADGGLDLGSLAPDVTGGDAGLSGDFNAEVGGFDTGGMDAGSFDAGSFDTGASLDVGSSFDVSSSFDTGGSYGGSDFGGGGFDGGGGGGGFGD